MSTVSRSANDGAEVFLRLIQLLIEKEGGELIEKQVKEKADDVGVNGKVCRCSRRMSSRNFGTCIHGASHYGWTLSMLELIVSICVLNDTMAGRYEGATNSRWRKRHLFYRGAALLFGRHRPCALAIAT